MTLMAVGLCAIILLTFLDWKQLLALRTDFGSNVHLNRPSLESGSQLETSADDADGVAIDESL